MLHPMVPYMSMYFSRLSRKCLASVFSNENLLRKTDALLFTSRDKRMATIDEWNKIINRFSSMYLLIRASSNLHSKERKKM